MLLLSPKRTLFRCYKNGVKHYLGYPIYDENNYDEIFQKFYWAATILTLVRINSFVLKSVSCVTFFSERLEPGPWTSSTENLEDNSRFFFVCAEKNEPGHNLQKNTFSQRAVSYFFTTAAAEVKRAGENVKITRFDHSVRSIVTCNILEQGAQSSPFKFSLLLAWLQRLDMLSVWTLSAKRV